MSEEMQVVNEIETEEALRIRLDQEAEIIELQEQVTSLRNELSFLQKLHGETVQGWSKYQRLHEKSQDALRRIREAVKATEYLSLTHAEKRGVLRLIERWADCELPDDVGDIPF